LRLLTEFFRLCSWTAEVCSTHQKLQGIGGEVEPHRSRS
jgi:hypothetical protein